MAVTPKALQASRIDKKVKIYSYKDVEIRSAYHRWLDEPATRSEVPVCDVDILSCIKNYHRNKRGAVHARFDLWRGFIRIARSSATAEDTGGVAFQNRLAACVTVKAAETETITNLVSVRTSFQLYKPIGDCGCFSARAAYISSVNIGGAREVLQQGVIVINKNATKSLVLASEPGLAANREIQIQLTCASPT